jgi:alpha-L-rhamnosidase
VRFAEMLHRDGSVYTENYRTAKSTDTYTAAHTGTVTWEPTFTFHGFRYVELSGFAAGIEPEAGWVTGIVLHSDMTRIGDFVSSHEMLNRLQSNIVWGQRGNFLEIPTDCPQRDERLGWTGDAQVFCPVALFNYDAHAFFKSWLLSMRDDQLPDGSIPHVIPAVLDGGSPGWQDAAVIIPWQVYLRTGDREVLAENFAMMERLVGWYRDRSAAGLIPEIGGFGDWLQPYADTFGGTPKPLIGTAFYAHDVQLLANAARVLGREPDAQRYSEEAAAVKQAFAGHYFTADGQLRNAPETQTAYLLAIAFDLIPAELQAKAAGHLVALVHAADDHLRTGFLGTPFINAVLDRMGYPDLAYTVLFKESYPSWFFSINQGATTMWERWNSYSRKDGFGDVRMNSFNHYAYGAIGQWMVERIAGLAPDAEQPGYKHIVVRPQPGGPLSSARAELDTPYGKAASSWTKVNGKLQLEIVVPPNATATVVLPDAQGSQKEVGAGTHRFECRM